MNRPSYVVITPVRNEQDHLRATIESMVEQTVRPATWVIVNDGSTDETGRIAHEASSRHNWIRVVDREDRGFRKSGGGVVETFSDGYRLIEKDQWDFVVKLDGDLSFESDFFSRALQRFSEDPRLGIGGGTIYWKKGDLWEQEAKDPAFHVRGATKIYRRECWRQIGHLYPVAGWDTLDEVKANMLGWRTYSFPDLKLLHHRPTGGAYGIWPEWVKNGRCNYASGYHPIFMLLKCVTRVFRRPYGIAALGLCVGFCSGYLKRIWRVDDPALIRYFRHQQMRRLLGRPSLWG
jgi:biofilm PGA synthesis N-glycosyltransferase PgaC